MTHQVTQMETINSGNWFSVNESVEKLKISRKTLYRWIKEGKINTQKQGKNRLVWIDDVTPNDTLSVSDTIDDTTNNTDDTPDDTVNDTNDTVNDTNNYLTQQVQYFRDKCDRLEIELSDTRKRHDTIILKMTEEKQMLLDEFSQTKNQTKPFWKFWG